MPPRDRLPISPQAAGGWASSEAGANPARPCHCERGLGAIPTRRFELIHWSSGSGKENRAASSQETWPIRPRS